MKTINVLCNGDIKYGKLLTFYITGTADNIVIESVKLRGGTDG